MKRFICILLCSLLIFQLSSITVLADDSKNEVSSVLSLDEALKLLEKNNIDIKLMDEQAAVYERQLEDAKGKAAYLKGEDFESKNNDIGDTTDDEREKRIEKFKELKVYPQKIQLEIDDLKHNRTNKLNLLKIDIEKQFAESLRIQSDISAIQDELNNLDKQIADTKLQIEAGTATDIDLKQIEVSRVQATSELDFSKNQLKEALLNLKKDLGIDLNKEISLEPLKFQYSKYDSSNIEDKIKAAVDKSYDYQSKEKGIDLANIEYEIVRNNTDFDGDVLKDMHEAEMNLSNKQVELGDIKPSLELSLRIAYNNLKNFENDVEIQKITLENKQVNLNAVKYKVEAEMDTNLSLLNAQVEVNKQQNTLQKAINDYMLAIKNFEEELASS